MICGSLSDLTNATPKTTNSSGYNSGSVKAGPTKEQLIMNQVNSLISGLAEINNQNNAALDNNINEISFNSPFSAQTTPTQGNAQGWSEQKYMLEDKNPDNDYTKSSSANVTDYVTVDKSLDESSYMDVNNTSGMTPTTQIEWKSSNLMDYNNGNTDNLSNYGNTTNPLTNGNNDTNGHQPDYNTPPQNLDVSSEMLNNNISRSPSNETENSNVSSHQINRNIDVTAALTDKAVAEVIDHIEPGLGGRLKVIKEIGYKTVDQVSVQVGIMFDEQGNSEDRSKQAFRTYESDVEKSFSSLVPGMNTVNSWVTGIQTTIDKGKAFLPSLFSDN